MQNPIVATSQSIPHDNTIAASIAVVPREPHWLAETVAQTFSAAKSNIAARRAARLHWHSDPGASRGM
jgi:hypothetical protein